MRGGRLQPGSIMKWLAVGLAASPTKGWGRRRELGSLPMKVRAPRKHELGGEHEHRGGGRFLRARWKSNDHLLQSNRFCGRSGRATPAQHFLKSASGTDVGGLAKSSKAHMSRIIHLPSMLTAE